MIAAGNCDVSKLDIESAQRLLSEVHNAQTIERENSSKPIDAIYAVHAGDTLQLHSRTFARIYAESLDVETLYLHIKLQVSRK